MTHIKLHPQGDQTRAEHYAGGVQERARASFILCEEKLQSGDEPLRDRSVPKQRNEVLNVVTLLDGWSRVIRVFYRQLRRDGQWQLQDRDLLDRGHGVSVLLYDPHRANVLLLRQPRIVATLNGDSFGDTIEVCSGLVESGDPYQCALREVEQETGHKLNVLIPLGQVYSSPGSNLELVSIYVGHYNGTTALDGGGGVPDEGEDIELLEVPLAEALQLISVGTIRDARTIVAFHLLVASLQQATLPALQS